jgi:hypothetical protein
VAVTVDEGPVEAFVADGADEAFGEGVCSRRTNRGADHPVTLGAEDIIERLGERVRKIELRADPFNDATWDRETSGIVLS